MYLQALLVCNALMLIVCIVAAFLNREAFSAGVSLLGFLITSILIFLPYFLLYIDKLSPLVRAVVMFIPFFISCSILMYTLYNLWAGNTAEMSFGGTGRIKFWQVRMTGSLIVLVTCWRGYKYVKA